MMAKQPDGFINVYVDGPGFVWRSRGEAIANSATTRGLLYMLVVYLKEPRK